MLQFSRHFSERHNPCPFQSSEVGCFMFFSAVSAGFSLALDSTFRLKGKCIYTALIFVVHAGMDHTVQLHQCLPSSPHSATTPMPAKFTSQCNYTNACQVHLTSVHQMTLPRLRSWTSNCSLLLTYLPQKDERLNRPGQLQVECSTGKVRRSTCNILPLCHTTNQTGRKSW